MMTDTPAVPALVGLGPGPTTGVTLPLARHHQLVGGADRCDIQLPGAHVGPQHAVLTNRDGHTWVQDLGTPGGTFVNGQRLGGAPYPLRRGDVVVFGTVALRLAVEPHSALTRPVPVVAAAGPDRWGDRERSGTRPAATRREELRAESAVLRGRGRRLLGYGGVAFVLGLLLFAAAAFGVVDDAGRSGAGAPLGPAVLGVPCGLLGWGISAVGMVLLVAGFMRSSAAAARQRQIDRELPWPTARRRRR
jgi:hypothetical protein